MAIPSLLKSNDWFSALAFYLETRSNFRALTRGRGKKALKKGNADKILPVICFPQHHDQLGSIGLERGSYTLNRRQDKANGQLGAKMTRLAILTRKANTISYNTACVGGRKIAAKNCVWLPNSIQSPHLPSQFLGGQGCSPLTTCPETQTQTQFRVWWGTISSLKPWRLANRWHSQARRSQVIYWNIITSSN